MQVLEWRCYCGRNWKTSVFVSFLHNVTDNFLFGIITGWGFPLMAKCYLRMQENMSSSLRVAKILVYNYVHSHWTSISAQKRNGNIG